MLSAVLTCTLLLHCVQGQDNSSAIIAENATATTQLPANFTSLTPNATASTVEDDFQYIVKLEYHFREEKVIDFIAEIIANGTEDTSITSSDVITLSGIQRFRLADTLALLQLQGIPSSMIFSVDLLENILNNLQMPFANFYVALKDSLKWSPAVTSQVMKDLQIDSGKFALAIITGEYNIYDVLRNASITEESLQIVANTTKNSTDDMFEAFKNVILNHVRKYDRREFDNLLKTLGVNKQMLMIFCNSFGVTIEDVYRVNSFRKLLDDIVLNLNKITSIGIVTENNTLFLNSNDYENCEVIKKYIKISTRSFLNDNVSTEIGTFIQKVTRNIVELQLKNISPKFIEVGKNYSSELFENCTYVTFVMDDLVFQSVGLVRNYKDYLEIDNNNQTFFNPGSPLICSHKLYGMAATKHMRTIDFDSFNGYHVIAGTTTTMKNATLPAQKELSEGSSRNIGSVMNIHTHLTMIMISSLLLFLNYIP